MVSGALAPLRPLLAYATRAGMLLLLATPALAHRQNAPAAESTTGLAIPSVSHGQMVVLAAHRAAILDLADRRYPPDPTLLALRSYTSLQFFACVWGLVPGSLTSESSPFNECMHAQLAGARALLLHLQAMPGEHADADALRRTIDREMLDNNASMVLCRYSDEPFHTATIIFPHWSSLPADPASLATVAALLALAGCGCVLARKALRRPLPCGTQTVSDAL